MKRLAKWITLIVLLAFTVLAFLLNQKPELFEKFDDNRTYSSLREAITEMLQYERSEDEYPENKKNVSPGEGSANTTRLLNQLVYLDTPRVALHPLSYGQYQQHRDNGAEMSELVTSLLMNELGQSDQFELYDRSMVSELFTEKSLILVNHEQDVGQSTFEKLPLSEFTLTGSLLSSDQGHSYTLKLIDNRTGQILGATTFPFTIDNIQQSIQKSLSFVHSSLAEAESSRNMEPRVMKNAGVMNKIAFGHFVEVGQLDAKVSLGQEITERLISRFVKHEETIILSRTQLFPLVFEELLRKLQYTDEQENMQRKNANYFIHGKYRFDRSDINSPLSIYLYIETIGYDRELIVLKARNWDVTFDLIEAAIIKYFPDPVTEISTDDIEESTELFLEALEARDMIYDKRILSGDLPLTASQFNTFASQYKPEKIAPTMELIEESLEVNPRNQASKLAMAMFHQSKGENLRSIQLMKEVSRSRDAASVDSAYRLLRKEKQNIPMGLTAEIFTDIAGSDQAELIFQALLDDGYLKKVGQENRFNDQKKSYPVFNLSHTLSLPNLHPNISIQAFEKLRYLYYYPGYQVKRTWNQSLRKGKHNIEAILHFDLASTLSNVHVINGSLPSIDFYPEIDMESKQRRSSNLEMAIDGFSSSFYLDTSYLEAGVLLGHILCQKEVSRCSSAHFVHSWIVDHTKAANLKGRGGMYFNVTEEINEKDRLTFLAADAVNRVAEANFTDMFQSLVMRKDYFINQEKKALQSLLANKDTPLSDKDRQRIIHAYDSLLRAYCISLKEIPRNVREPKKYTPAMESLATIASESDSAFLLRKRLLADLETEYPSIYPYLIVNSKPVMPFINTEQDEMLEKITSGKVTPIEQSRLMRATMKLFNQRIASGNFEVAKQYIAYYADYYGINHKTAIDFAYLYHLIGDTSKSNKLLKEYSKDTFSISNFTQESVNGTYRHNGFETGGQLRFVNLENKTHYFIYQASDIKFGLGEMHSKWRLFNGGTSSHRGNTYAKNRNLFAFGNGGRMNGEMNWPSTPESKSLTEATAGSETKAFFEVAAEKEGKNLSTDAVSTAKKSFDQLFKEGYWFGANQRIAIKGYPRRATVGPLQDSYFPSAFSKTRQVSAVKEQLYEKGYLTVSGIPKFSQRHLLRDDIKRDFPGYSNFDRKNLIKALITAKRVDGAGNAMIYHRKDDVWENTATLIPDDAISERAFGLASAIHEEYALVCDYKDGFYSYKQIGMQWVQQQRIESRCYLIAMDDKWAIVTSSEQVIVYKNNAGIWTKSQTLIPDNYLRNKDKGHHFKYFGSALAILNDRIFIGNPGGGANRRGEVYIFSLSDQKWIQTEVIRPNETVSQFGTSISVSNDFMVVGDPSTGKIDTPVWQSGSVFVYANEQSQWTLKAQLVAKGRPKYARFGERVLIEKNQHSSVLIKSDKNVYRYGLSKQPD